LSLARLSVWPNRLEPSAVAHFLTEILSLAEKDCH
jgi:hypothetical protein